MDRDGDDARRVCTGVHLRRRLRVLDRHAVDRHRVHRHRALPWDLPSATGGIARGLHLRRGRHAQRPSYNCTSMATHNHYIDDQWMPGGGPVLTSTDPATGETVWTGRAATSAEVDDAVTAARRAFEPWAD